MSFSGIAGYGACAAEMPSGGIAGNAFEFAVLFMSFSGIAGYGACEAKLPEMREAD